MSSTGQSGLTQDVPWRRKRRVFTDEFKQDAVRLVTTGGYTFAAAAKSLGIGEQSLRQWHAKLAPPPTPCGDDASAAFLLSITDVNEMPAAYSITTNMNEDGVLTGRVWGWDPEAQPLTYELVTDVNEGTLTFQANGSIVYRPRRNFIGTDTFTFRVFDGVLWSNTATVTFIVT
jgi:hypothetical protein